MVCLWNNIAGKQIQILRFWERYYLVMEVPVSYKKSRSKINAGVFFFGPPLLVFPHTFYQYKITKRTQRNAGMCWSARSDGTCSIPYILVQVQPKIRYRINAYSDTFCAIARNVRFRCAGKLFQRHKIMHYTKIRFRHNTVQSRYNFHRRTLPRSGTKCTKMITFFTGKLFRTTKSYGEGTLCTFLAYAVYFWTPHWYCSSFYTEKFW